MDEEQKFISIVNTIGSKSIEELLEATGISGRLTRKLIKSGNILVEGKPVEKKHRLRSGEKITIVLEDEEYDVEPQPIEIEILYEDRDVIVLNKPAYIVVHPTKNIKDGTLANGVAYYFKTKNLKRKIRLVSRLDRDTSGAIIFAKNAYGHQHLAKQMEECKLKKSYIAIVECIVADEKGYIDLPIGLSEDGIRQEVREDGLNSFTSYEVIERQRGTTLVKLLLVTGRTHQLRVHLAAIGNPIVGDSLYGTGSNIINRQALHAAILEFESPETGEWIKIESILPYDIQVALQQFKSI